MILVKLEPCQIVNSEVSGHIVGKLTDHDNIDAVAEVDSINEGGLYLGLGRAYVYIASDHNAVNKNMINVIKEVVAPFCKGWKSHLELTGSLMTEDTAHKILTSEIPPDKITSMLGSATLVKDLFKICVHKE